MEGCHLCPAHRGGGRSSYVLVSNAGKICAVRVNLQFYAGAFSVPVVAHTGRRRQGAEDVFKLARQPAQSANVLGGLCSAYVGIVGDEDVQRKIDGGILQLTDVKAGSRYFRGQDRLQVLHELAGKLFVSYLHDDLRIVQLLKLW
jgi:hypothetical protein